MFNIKLELTKLPNAPGVYIMRDDENTVIYVGKAINLKNRVRQYFQSATDDDPKTLGIRASIATFEVIVTDNEVAALILECNLIKKYLPRYNTLLKDDKSYPYIKYTQSEDWPRAVFVWRYEKDGDKYFGPFVGCASETIDLIGQLWPLKQCTKNFPKDGGKTARPCLNYHIGKCPAPCSGKIGYEEYMERANAVLDFLNGNHANVLKLLETRMYEYSEVMDYERAADMRNKMTAVKRLSEKQILDKQNGSDQDIIAFARRDDEAVVEVFFVRGGKMQDREELTLQGVLAKRREDILSDFVKQYYSSRLYIPKEIILQSNITDAEVIAKWLSDLRHSRVTLTVPQKGDKKRLVDMAARNANFALEQKREKRDKEETKTIEVLSALQKTLNLPSPPIRIESVDISNVQGFENVGSLVVYIDGKPARNEYRKFKIKSVDGANDFASMKEVITRRFSRYLREKESGEDGKFSNLPDLLLLDGGKPQISAVTEALEALGLEIPICGMVKDDKHRTRALLYKNEEINMPANSEVFRLVTRIQTEVHRFAIEYHRKLREKAMVRSRLDEVQGIGEKRRTALIKHFGSVEGVERATLEELTQAPNMNKRAAAQVYEFFHPDCKKADNDIE